MAVIYIVRGTTERTGGITPEDMEILVQKVTEETMDETILVTGKIVAENEQKVYAEPENGEIKEFKVEENATVKAGDTLFVYDGTKLDNEFNAAVRNRNMLENNTKA